MSRRGDTPRVPVVVLLDRADLSLLVGGASSTHGAVRLLADGHDPIARLLQGDPSASGPSPDGATDASRESTRGRLGTGQPAGAAPFWVLLPAEAKARGFKSALAFRRWCRRHEVPVRCDAGGRMQWVDRRDVDRAVEGLPARNDGGVHAEAGRSVAEFVARQRR